MVKKGKTKETEINPLVKGGDEIVLLKGHRGSCISKYEGQLFVVAAGTNKSTKAGSFNARLKSNPGVVLCIYYAAPKDEFAFPSKEMYVDYYTQKRDVLLSEIKEVEKELDFHKKYDSQEDFVADKLAKILAKPDKKSIKKVLQELKSSNLL